MKFWGIWEWMKRIFSFIIPMDGQIQREKLRMKIVKDIYRILNPHMKFKDGECDNYFYLNVLIYFRSYFLEEETFRQTNLDEWLLYLHTLKACFIIMGAITVCEEIELAILARVTDPLQKIDFIYQFYLEEVSAYSDYRESFYEGINYYQLLTNSEYSLDASEKKK